MMLDSGNIEQRPSHPRLDATLLIATGLLSAIVYAAITQLSFSFAFEHPEHTRPLRLVLGLFAVAFFLYLFAIRKALKLRTSSVMIVVTFAFVFRGIVLFSEPIQEVDIYRYLWDGVASTNGTSPFDFTPYEVLEADATSPDLPQDLARLVAARDSSHAIRTVLERVHFNELPTVYPPVSQVVFWVAAKTSPANSSMRTRLRIMKAWLLLFDIGTIGMIALTLRWSDLNLGWLVAYAWCPLVIKEFANSGHLDSIAAFLSTAAIYFSMRAFYPSFNQNTDQLLRRSFRDAVLGAVLLGLAVGAKLYPVALIPILCWTSFATLSRSSAITASVTFALVSIVSLAPMLLPTNQSASVRNAEIVDLAEAETGQPGSDNPFAPVDELPPIPDEVSSPTTEVLADRQAGLKAFLSHWMMNDFIFLNVAENLTPDDLTSEASRPWFVFVPNSIRSRFVAAASSWLGMEEARVPFLFARAITAMVFLVLSLFWARDAARNVTSAEWIERVFLTMAWFWLLLPTQNPWYWVWALPWIPFAKNRVWLAMSGLVMIYYLRFYFATHFNDVTLGYTPYKGEWFFHYVVVWFEYLPWFLLLTWSSFAMRKGNTVRLEKSARSLAAA